MGFVRSSMGIRQEFHCVFVYGLFNFIDVYSTHFFFEGLHQSLVLDVWENTILDVNPGYKNTMDANKIAKGSLTMKQPTLCGFSSRIGLVDNASFGFHFRVFLGCHWGFYMF